MKNKQTLLVNLYGGPCAGKSTICAGIFYELKKRNIDCEMATEFAKDKVWEESFKVLDDQIYLFGKQYHRVYRLNNKVEVIITDSPFPLNVWYSKGMHGKIYEDFVFQCLNEFEHIDYFINRGNHYNENGRQQNLEEAVAIDNGIKELLNKHNIKYIEYAQHIAVKEIVNDILNYLIYGNEIWKEMTS